MNPTKLISLVTRACLAMAAFASATAHADARTHVLRELDATPLVPGAGGWQPNRANGMVGTWDDTSDNTIVSVVHTPMNSWGLPVAQRPRGDRATTCTTLGVGTDGRCGAGGLCVDQRWKRRVHTDPTPRVCGSHSDEVLNQVWDLLSAARYQIDITSLANSSTSWQEAMRNGIQYAANELVRTSGVGPVPATAHRLQVRVLYGEQSLPPWWKALAPGRDMPPLTWMKQEIELLGAGLAVPTIAAGGGNAGRFELVGGVFHPSVSIWNHAKIIAVDGLTAMVGGHNLWGYDYLDRQRAAPGHVDQEAAAVHDVSLIVRGSAARSAHQYVNTLWDVVCSAPDPATTTYVPPGSPPLTPGTFRDVPGAQAVWRWDQATGAAVIGIEANDGLLLRGYRCRDGIRRQMPPLPSAQQPAPAPFAAPGPGGPGIPIVAVGKTGSWNLDQYTYGASGSGQNPSDTALVSMIRGADVEVLISQQDVRGPEKQYADQAKQGVAGAQLDLSAMNLGRLGVWNLGVWRWGQWGITKYLIDSVGVQGLWTDDVLAEIARAAARNVRVRIVIADPDNVDGAYQSMGAYALIDAIKASWADAFARRPSAIASNPALTSDALLCNIEIAHLRDSHDHPARNHAKMVIVDPATAGGPVGPNPNAAFYVGSQNLYGNDLAEFGYMVFSPTATATVKAQYWDQAWLYSSGGPLGERVYRACGPVTNQPAAEAYGQPMLPGGRPDFARGAANAGGAVTSLNAPNGVAYSQAEKHLYIMDSGNGRVARHDFSVAPPTFAYQGGGGGGITRVSYGATVNGGHVAWFGKKLVVSDPVRNRVVLYDYGANQGAILGQTSDTVAAPAAAPPTQASLNNPQGVWTDGAKIMVADTGNNRVLIWNTWPAVDNANADVVLGQANFVTGGAGAPVSASTMNAPHGVHSDGARLYVADTGNNRVLIWNAVPALATDPKVANLVLGQPAGGAVTTSSGAGTSDVLMTRPSDLQTFRNALFVVDAGNHRVMVFSPNPTTSAAPARWFLGQAASTAGAAPVAPTQRALLNPQDIDIDGHGRVFISDTGHNRVIEHRMFVPN
jgi:phosphatidylserine/phosphatidylglycerophosphate/cardiolipin synthase-like enzyme